jgi:hypothetical protein
MAPDLEPRSSWQPPRVHAQERTCPHCATGNLVAECIQDGRLYVLTTAHIEGRPRAFDDGPVKELPSSFAPSLCDFCAAKAAGLSSIEVIEAGLRQNTCPVCHTEFLSSG